MSASGVVGVRGVRPIDLLLSLNKVRVPPDNVNTTSGWNNTEDTEGGEEADHLGSLPSPIAGLLIATFGESHFCNCAFVLF